VVRISTKNSPDKRIIAYLDYLREHQRAPAEEMSEIVKMPESTKTSETVKTPEAQEIPQQQTRSRAPSVWKELAALAIKIMVIALVSVLIFTFLYGFHQNTDPDMRPMVQTGDLVLFYRLNRDYSIGDLLLLDFQGERQVRRVVARAGDTVDFADGELIINGSVQQESSIFQQTWRYETGVSFPLTVGDGQVFVLGDAREGATDSRLYGPVNKDDTLGTVITVIRRRHL